MQFRKFTTSLASCLWFVSLLSSESCLLAQSAPETNPPTISLDIDRTARVNPWVEDRVVGENRQPGWTAERPFATTRVYVLPPWQVEFEQWWKGKFARDGSYAHLFQSELGIGLPYRFQLDLYENLVEATGRGLRHDGNQVELRWALAEWGRIPLNPTLYGEWKFNHNGPDAYEVKLLLGDQLAPRLRWGFNAFFEQEVGGGRASELGASMAVSYSLIDQHLSAGVEMNLERASEPNLRGRPEVEFLIGPSVQWRPTSRMRFDFVPLLGTTGVSPRVEVFIVFGFALDRGSASDERLAPTSVRGR